MESAFFTYRTLTRDLPQVLAQKAAEPAVSRAVRRFQEQIGRVGGIDDLLSNPVLWCFALVAFDLGHMAGARSYMRGLLVEGTCDAGSLANQLDDMRFRAFATAFDFAGRGAPAVAAEAGEPVAEHYVRAMLERDEGAVNAGVRLALAFHRRAPRCALHPVPASALTAERDLWTVVRIALDLPETAVPQARARLIGARLDPAELEDPVRLDALVRRFCVKWDARQHAAPILARLAPAGAGILRVLRPALA